MRGADSTMRPIGIKPSSRLRLQQIFSGIQGSQTPHRRF